MNTALDSLLPTRAGGHSLPVAGPERVPEKFRRTLPTSTYRLQFNRTFTFLDARRIVPYLARLGVSHCYASPFLKARSGSPHGYDVVDHNSFNPEIGTESQFEEFVCELHAYGMGLILDFVPNHMAVASNSNAWWMDVLEDGPSSPYASFFDIDWMPLKPDLAHKVLLPVLGDQFGRILENGQLELKLQDGAFSLYYFDRRFPIATRTIGLILKHRIEDLTQRLGSDNPHLSEYQSILTAIGHLPSHIETDLEKVAEGRREKEVIRRRVKELSDASPAVREFLAENVRQFNGTRGDPRSFDLLDQLLLDQAYRLAFWRVAADEINYRRFFDVNELAAICMENPAVFDQAHRLVLHLIKAGFVDGIRIDHPDGLYAPLEYFTKLVAAASDHEDHRGEETLPAPELYLVVEKILGRGEHLPADWPVHGTTGYDFLNSVNSLFVDRTNAKAFDAIYAKFTHEIFDVRMLAYRCKKLIMDASMSSEISVLGHELDRISEQDRSSRDFTLRGLMDALREVIACFPVYRTYITSAGVPDRDRRYLEMAVARAKRMNPAVSESIYDFVRDILLLKLPDQASEESRQVQQRFVSRFQQVTSPIMAKAVEDTTFYIYNRLVSLNEVGSDPEKFGQTTAVFHQHNLDRLANWPNSMLASSTHDTKRSEDVRARINVLSELPRDWRTVLFRWSRVNHRKKVEIDGELVPSRNDEYLLYQTLVGTWPTEPMDPAQRTTYIERMQQYMLKATREAKVHTSWISPHTAYEQALSKFVAGILTDLRNHGFLSMFVPFAAQIAEFGLWNSLSQTLLKLTSPGVPDLYQGTELFDFSLVDPDNRRPVDFPRREQQLNDLESQLVRLGGDKAALLRVLLNNRSNGNLKLYVLWQVLNHRLEHPDLYSSGSYLPLTPTGRRPDNVCAFARVSGAGRMIVIVPRFLTQMIPEPLQKVASSGGPFDPQAWEDTTVAIPEEFAGREFHNLLSGEIVSRANLTPDGALPLATILEQFPIALLYAES